MIKQVKNTALLLAATLLINLVSGFTVHAAPTVTMGGLLQFTSQSDFETAFPGLPREDFEESPVAPENFTPCTGPVDSSTNQPPNCFVPGDIVEGLSIDSLPAHQLAVFGSGYSTLTTLSVTLASSLSGVMSISFPGHDVYAVGFHLASLLADATYTIKVYGAGNTLLDTISLPDVSTAGTFIGVYSPLPITSITLDNNGANEFVDNIQFGGAASTLTLYTDRASFELAHPGLLKEDFEESTIAPASHLAFPESLDKNTNTPGAFVPGDILDDIHIKTISTGAPLTGLRVLGENYATDMGNSSKLVCSNNGSRDDLQVMFYNDTASGYEVDTYAVGMDLMPFAPPSALLQNAIIAVYDFLGRLLGAASVTVSAGVENFFGVYSKEPIIKITFQFAKSIHECIDNIQFGGSPAGLTFYTSETDFRRTRGNLPREDFSKSPVADSIPHVCREPLDSKTSQAGCFMPGDILPNITFQTENSLNAACPDCMALWGANTPPMENTTPVLSVGTSDLLEIAFPGNKVHYAGMSIYSYGIISVYGPDGTLAGSAVKFPVPSSVMNFLGVESDEPISRITIFGNPARLNEITFGGKFPWSSYLPAIINNNR